MDVRTFNGKGDILTWQSYLYVDGQLDPENLVLNTYDEDEDGNRVTTQTERDGEILSYGTYTYDRNGNMLTHATGSSPDSIHSKTVYTYDYENRNTSEIRTDSRGISMFTSSLSTGVTRSGGNLNLIKEDRSMNVSFMIMMVTAITLNFGSTAHLQKEMFVERWLTIKRARKSPKWFLIATGETSIGTHMPTMTKGR